jgi:hypothetical protein
MISVEAKVSEALRGHKSRPLPPGINADVFWKQFKPSREQINAY